MLSTESALNLAPLPIESRRKDRYRAADWGLSLEAFAPDDRTALAHLYRAMEDLYHFWLDTRDNPDRLALARRIAAFAESPLVEAAESLGSSTLDPARSQEAGRAEEASPSPALRRALHDLRGGALFALRLYGDLGAEELKDDDDLLRSGVFLARDQAKIMRHLLPKLDPEGRARDEEEKVHSLDDVVAKWDGFELRSEGATGRVSVQADWSGGLASCCLEASAVDRILYNLVNNSVRFSVDGSVDIRIVPVADGALRWVVSNPVTADQAGWLDEHAGFRGARLFQGGQTRGGTGVGLTTPAELVSSAFGLQEVSEAVGEGFLGARWDTESIHVWFHWPMLEGR